MSKVIRSITALALGLGFALTASGTAMADPGQIEPPTIIPREVWGAREPQCQWPGRDGDKVTHVVIHHSYEPTDPPSLESAYAAIRHIQNLHMDDNGWCDVGYSYLVDWFGNVYEGSKGTTQRPITSAHTSGLNTEGVGIVMIGNYQELVPSAQTVAAAGRVAGWVLGFYGFDADQDVQLTVGGSNNKFTSGSRITVPAITAHRDVVNTECPGDGGYSVLDDIRAEAVTVNRAMHATGAFGAGIGTGAEIFRVGSPSIPLGNNAQDTAVMAEEYGLHEAVEGGDYGEDPLSEHEPSTEPPDGGVDDPVTTETSEPEATAPAPATGGHSGWLWALLPLALLGGLAAWWRGRNRVTPEPVVASQSVIATETYPNTETYTVTRDDDGENSLRS